MENIIDTLITDRTQADVDRARYLNNLWDPRALQWRGTPQERAEWEAGPRGAYGFADMNRVAQAAAYLIGVLEELGYSVDVEDVTPAYNIRLSVDPAGGGAASGAGVFYEGDTATVTAQAGEKYGFAGWMEAGQIVSTDAAYTFTVEKSRNLTAAFVLKKFQVIVSADPPGAGEVTGAGTYDIDTEVTVAATAGDGYVFTRWAEGGVTVSEGPEYTFTLDRDRTLSAVMAKTYVITVMQNDPDGGTTTGGGTYLDGQTVTVAAAAGGGYEFTGWTENGQMVSTEAVYSFQAAADRNLLAQFVKTHVITLLVGPAGGGTATGGGTVLEGAQVTVTAVPDGGYRFVAWKSDGEQVSTSNPYTFTVLGDQTLTALFEEIPVYTVAATIDPTDFGVVTGAGQYKEGETCTLKATVSGTNQFVGWKDGDTVVSTSDTYSFTVTGDITLTATFKAFSVVFTAITIPRNFSGGVSFGNGVFVGFASGLANYSTSADLKSWSSGSVSETNFKASKMVFGNGKFLNSGMYSTSYNGVVYSIGGTSWTYKGRVPIFSSSLVSGLDFANGLFLAGYSSTQYQTSPDGITWSNNLIGSFGFSTSFRMYSFTYGNGVWVAVGNDVNAIYSTNNRSSWATAPLPSGGSWYRVAFGNGIFVAVNGSTTSSYAKAAKSTDGKTWAKITLPANVPCRNVIFANGMFFIASYSTAQIFYSADGDNWNTATIPGSSTNHWENMAYGNGKLIVVRNDTNAAYAEI